LTDKKFCKYKFSVGVQVAVSISICNTLPLYRSAELGLQSFVQVWMTVL